MRVPPISWDQMSDTQTDVFVSSDTARLRELAENLLSLPQSYSVEGRAVA